MVLKYGDDHAKNGTYCTEKTSNVSQKVQEAIDGASVLKIGRAHFERDRVPELVFVRQLPCIYNIDIKASITIDLQISYIPSIII